MEEEVRKSKRESAAIQTRCAELTEALKSCRNRLEAQATVSESYFVYMVELESQVDQLKAKAGLGTSNVWSLVSKKPSTSSGDGQDLRTQALVLGAQREASKLKAELEHVKKDLCEKETSLNVVSAAMDAMNSEVLVIGDKLGVANAKLGEAERENILIHADLEFIREELETSLAEKLNLQDIITRKSRNIAKLERKVEQLRSVIEEKDYVIDAAVLEQRKLFVNLDYFKENSQRRQVSEATSEVELEKLHADLEAEREMADDLRTTIQEKDARLAEVSETLKFTEKQLADKSTTVDALEEKTEEREKRLRELERLQVDVKELEEKHEQTQAHHVKIARQVIKNLEAKLVEKEAEIERKMKEIEDVTESLRESESVVSAKNGEIAGLIEDIAGLSRRIEDLELSLAQTREDVSSAKRTIQARDEEISEHKSTLIARGDEISNLKLSLETSQHRGADLSEKLDGTNKALAETREIVKSKERDLKDLEESKDRQLHNLQECKERELQNLKEFKDSELESLQQSKERELASLQESKDRKLGILQESKDRELGSLQESKDRELTSLWDAKDHEIQSLQQSMESELQILQESKDRDIQGLEHALSDRTEELAECRGKFENSQRELKDTESSLFQSNTLLAEARQLIQNKDSDVSQLKQKLEAVQKELERVKAHSVTLVQSVKKAQEDCIAAQTDITEKDDELSLLTMNLSVAEEELVSLKREHASSLQQVAALQNELRSITGPDGIDHAKTVELEGVILGLKEQLEQTELSQVSLKARLENENRSLTKGIKELRDERDSLLAIDAKLKGQLEKYRNDLSKVQLDLESQNRNLAEELNSVAKANARLRANEETLNAQMEDSRKLILTVRKTLESENDSLREEIRQLSTASSEETKYMTNQLSELRGKLFTAQSESSKKVQDLEEKNSLLDKELKKMSQALAVAEKRPSNSIVSELQHKNAGLREEIELLSKSLEATQDELKELTKSRDRAVLQLSSVETMERTMRSKEIEVNHLKSVLADLEDSTAARVNDSERTSALLRTRLSEAEKTLQAMTETFTTNHTSSKNGGYPSGRTEEEVEALRSILAKRDGMITNLREWTKAINVKMSRLEEQLEDREAKLREANSFVWTLEQRLLEKNDVPLNAGAHRGRTAT